MKEEIRLRFILILITMLGVFSIGLGVSFFSNSLTISQSINELNRKESFNVVFSSSSIHNNMVDIGDIIAYKYDNQIIIHRIKKVIKDKNSITYLVKGDQNEIYDSVIIKKDMIKGKIEKSISNLGKPTIRIYSIFK